MYEVIDLIYTEEEGQAVFQGAYEECQAFIADNGGYGMKILPV